MKRILLTALLSVHGPVLCSAADFEPPVRVMSEGGAVRVEGPGYAAPCWTDIDGDEKKDLLVGQFAQGKIHVFKNLGDAKSGVEKLAAGEFLQADDKAAEIPGVW